MIRLAVWAESLEAFPIRHARVKWIGERALKERYDVTCEDVLLGGGLHLRQAVYRQVRQLPSWKVPLVVASAYEVRYLNQ